VTRQSCLEVWGEFIAAGEGAASAQTPLPAPAADRLAAAQRYASARAPAFYEQIMTARLHIATASVLCELDDDDPFEDESALADHMDAAAVVGRCEPAGALATLSGALQAARGRMEGAAAVAGGGASATDLPADAASIAEECWWLLCFAGHLLADEAKGESPTVPEQLRVLSQAASRHAVAGGASAGGVEALAAADPVIRASSEALLVCQQQVHGTGAASQSPLLTAQVRLRVGAGSGSDCGGRFRPPRPS
jgi:hypothetical protein